MVQVDTASSGTPGQTEDSGFIAGLLDMSSFLDQQESLESSLKQLAARVASLLGVESSSIMLLKDLAEKRRSKS